MHVLNELVEWLFSNSLIKTITFFIPDRISIVELIDSWVCLSLSSGVYSYHSLRTTYDFVDFLNSETLIEQK